MLFEGDPKGLLQVNRLVAERAGAIVPIFAGTAAELAEGKPVYPLEFLVMERSISTNTAAAGGNASLMTIVDEQLGLLFASSLALHGR